MKNGMSTVNRTLATLMALRGSARRGRSGKWLLASQVADLLEEANIEINRRFVGVTLTNLINEGLVAWRDIEKPVETGRPGRNPAFEYSITPEGTAIVNTYVKLAAS
jgi:hypothetical protein